MLSSSAETTGRRIDLRGIVDREIDPLVPGGRELVAMARATTGAAVGDGPFREVATVLGPEAAADAVGVVANFEIMNRVVDATGLPVGKGSRAALSHIIEVLGLEAFPHATH